MSDFVDAVLDTLSEMEQRHYDSDRAIVYCHPNTWNKAEQDLNLYRRVGEDKNVYGKTVECTPNVPEGMVIAAHIDAARIGPEGIVFATVGDDE